MTEQEKKVLDQVRKFKNAETVLDKLLEIVEQSKK